MKINRLEALVLSAALEDWKYQVVRTMRPDEGKPFFKALEHLELKLEAMSEDKRRQSRTERVHDFTWSDAVKKFIEHHQKNIVGTN